MSKACEQLIGFTTVQNNGVTAEEANTFSEVQIYTLIMEGMSQFEFWCLFPGLFVFFSTDI